MLNSLNLSRLTPVERLLLWRDRRGLTQRGLAARAGLTRRQVQYLEDGNRPEEAERILRRLRAQGAPLTDREICLICRWRSGLSTEALAAVFGISRVTLLKWEHEGNPLLLSHWRAEGYRVPRN